MKKVFSLILAILAILILLYLFHFVRGTCPVRKADASEGAEIHQALLLLRSRKDSQALDIFQKILDQDPENLSALWGKAEVLRRGYNYKDSETILNRILKKHPDYPSALATLSYIEYKNNRLKQALKLTKRLLKLRDLDRENRALGYMMLGTINSRRSSEGWLLNKIHYGMQIQSYFIKAEREAPELPEVHLGLGTFYLKAPAFAGGDLDKAIEQLETALKLAPEFATVNARLAQAYKKKGDLKKYHFYFRQTERLDPRNEVLKEIIKEE